LAGNGDVNEQEETDNDKLGELAEQLCELVEEMERLEAGATAASSGPRPLSSSSSAASSISASTPSSITRADVEALGGALALSVLDGLGLSKPPRRLGLRLSELSGGWRMRAALAQVLINLDQIDVLLLDEPTNHCKHPLLSLSLSFCVVLPSSSAL